MDVATTSGDRNLRLSKARSPAVVPTSATEGGGASMFFFLFPLKTRMSSSQMTDSRIICWDPLKGSCRPDVPKTLQTAAKLGGTAAMTVDLQNRVGVLPLSTGKSTWSFL